MIWNRCLGTRLAAALCLLAAFASTSVAVADEKVDPARAKGEPGSPTLWYDVRDLDVHGHQNDVLIRHTGRHRHIGCGAGAAGQRGADRTECGSGHQAVAGIQTVPVVAARTQDFEDDEPGNEASEHAGALPPGRALRHARSSPGNFRGLGAFCEA